MSDIMFLKTMLLSMQMVFSNYTAPVITDTLDIGKVYACPRCRRATPPGPRHRPHPGFPKDKSSSQGEK